jgi:hypothetical protein
MIYTIHGFTAGVFTELDIDDIEMSLPTASQVVLPRLPRDWPLTSSIVMECHKLREFNRTHCFKQFKQSQEPSKMVSKVAVTQTFSNKSLGKSFPMARHDRLTT